MRNRLIKLLLLPVAGFLWIIGWTMMWAGTLKEQETWHEAATEEESITMMPMIPTNRNNAKPERAHNPANSNAHKEPHPKEAN